MRVVERYMRRLGESIPGLRIMASDGGTIRAGDACRRAVQTLLSGPAGGVIVPRWPGLFSTLGMVLADMTVEKSRTVLGREPDWRSLEREALAELEGRVEAGDRVRIETPGGGGWTQ
jgi:N-methylhydantoinase A/oxoprolinase/acetone carboxylase beta subunit